MRTRRYLLSLAVLLLPTAARADMHHASGSAAPSYSQGSNLWGVHASAEWVPKKAGPWSIPLDFSYAAGAKDGVFESKLALQAGVRITRHAYYPPHAHGAPATGTVPPKEKFIKVEPFAHFLMGWTRIREDQLQPDHDFSTTVGVGADFLKGGRSGLRLQIDEVIPVGRAKAFARVSLGYVIRFE